MKPFPTLCLLLRFDPYNLDFIILPRTCLLVVNRMHVTAILRTLGMADNHIKTHSVGLQCQAVMSRNNCHSHTGRTQPLRHCVYDRLSNASRYILDQKKRWGTKSNSPTRPQSVDKSISAHGQAGEEDAYFFHCQHQNSFNNDHLCWLDNVCFWSPGVGHKIVNWHMRCSVLEIKEAMESNWQMAKPPTSHNGILLQTSVVMHTHRHTHTHTHTHTHHTHTHTHTHTHDDYPTPTPCRQRQDQGSKQLVRPQCMGWKTNAWPRHLWRRRTLCGCAPCCVRCKPCSP